MTAVIAVAVSLPLATAPQARAQTPGVAAAPVPIYAEAFENNIGTTPVLLTSYTGAAPTNVTYTANTAWLTNCNGDIVDYNMTALPPNCAQAGSSSGMNQLRSEAYALGVLRNSATPATNNALSAFTDQGNGTPVNPGAGLVQLQSSSIALPSGGSNAKHYIIFSVDGAALNCSTKTDPLLQFNLLSGATATPAGTQIDTCTDPRGKDVSVPFPSGGNTTVHVGTYLTTGAIPFTGTSLAIQLVNNQSGGLGNDGAIDNVSVLDATPQLTKTFSPANQVAGLPSTLTFTITNTTDLLAKPGWSFTDSLPAGLKVASPANTSTTCTNGTITAAAGATSVTAGGDLTSGQTSCTVTLNVTATPGTYTNVPGNVTSSGVIAPPSASVTFVPPAPAITVAKTASPATASKAGTTVTYSFAVKNTGNVDLSNVALTDAQTAPAGALASGPTCPSSTLTAGSSMTCTATYVTTQADADNGSVADTATVTGSPPAILSLPAATGTGSQTVPIAAAPALTVVKSASPATVTKAGTAVTYSFAVNNTGNVTVHGIAINETAFSGTGTPPAITCLLTTLAPGASTTCSGTYTVTQADMDAGKVTNTATAAGLTPTGSAVTSPSSGATVTATPAPALSLVKSASVPTFRAGQTISYSFQVTNTGNITVNGIAVSETVFSGTGTPSAITCPVTTLAPGAQTTCTATYDVTQADINAGQVTNTATAAGTAVNGATVTSTSSSVTVPETPAPALTMVKSASPATVSSAGTTVTYSFAVTNAGNVTINSVAVNETGFSGTGTLSAITCLLTTLAPGQSTTCTATYVTTQADIDAGSITNTAKAAGLAPSGSAVTSPPSTATDAVTQTLSLGLTKSAAPTTVTKAGQTVTYSFAVTNAGNVTVHGIAIDETAFSGTGTLPAITCLLTTLAPGASTTCGTTYTVTQADIDAGKVTNTAHAAGLAPDGSAVTSPASGATVTATPAPALSVVKSAVVSSFRAGQVITYTFTVTNAGNVTVNGITVNETAFSGTGTLSAITCPVTTLAPGAQTTCTATYDITQADIDSGQVTNTADATGTAANGATVTAPASTVTVPQTPAPALTMVKTASPATVSSAGTTVTYSFAVTNAGNVTINGITVNETAFSGTGTLSPITCPATTLIPGQSTTCTATYTVTQADVDAGGITNTADATGTAPNGATVTSPSSTATATAGPSPALTVVKSGALSSFRAGQLITYSFTVTNAGNVTINGITVNETAFSGTGTPPAVTCPVTTLAPGDQTICTATYDLTQADIDAGQVTNTATAAGTAANGATVTSPSSSITVPQTAAPALTMVKSADPGTVTSAGTSVTYSFDVTNAGNVSIHGIAVNETAFSGTGTPPDVTCPPASLIPGQTTTCTATYTVTQADIDAGSITNTATATGTAPDGSTVTSPAAGATVTATQSPALTMVKSAAPATVTSAGATVTYSFAVTNAGNVTINSVAVNETAFTGTGTLSPITCPATTLIPGQSTTCTATYAVTQADIDAGSITNIARAAGTAPDGSTIASTGASTATVAATPAPALTLVKSAAPAAVTSAGASVTYSFVVANAGNVTIHGVTINETAFTGTGTPPAITCPVTTLVPGEPTTCTATYTVTQADIDAGSISNTATAAGTAPDKTGITSPPSTAAVTAGPAPALTMAKTVSPTTITTAGQALTYSYLVTNTGNVTIHGVTINETAFTGTGTPPAITCPVTTLAPGEPTTCTATYTVTQADIDAGSISNTARAAGTTPGGPGVTSSPSTAQSAVSAAVKLGLTKSATPVTVSKAGTTVTYSYLVTNTGNVTIHGVAINETAFSGTGTLSAITCTATTLAPGDQTTCTATYTVTQADIDAGQVTNAATATGTAPDGSAATSPLSAATITASLAPALTLVQSATPASASNAGATVTYSYLVTNTGNATVNGIAIDETTFTGTGTLSTITCPVTTLAPGDQTTCTATYPVTQADIDAGKDSSTAKATGTAPDGSAVISLISTAPVTFTASPVLTVVKSAALPGFRTGQAITYSFVVTNAGNVTVHGIAINETAFSGTGALSAITCPVTTLVPGAQTTCTADYDITQADIDAGKVSNTADAAGTAPGGSAVTSPPSTVTVPQTPAPALTVVKSASPATVADAGDTVTYSFDVGNAGNVTINGIAIVETAFSGTGTLSAITCTATTLAPGEHTTCTASYTVTQADIDAGKVTNSATATGTAPNGATVTSPASGTTVTAAPAPALTVVKSAALPSFRAGQTITYSFAVTNAGNVTINGITVNETVFSGTGTPPAITCPVTTLAPGAQTTCTATYDITQSDIDAGSIANTATATGTAPGGSTVTSTASTVTVPQTPAPALTVVKSAAPATVTAAGQTVAYSFDVGNAGNVTIHGIAISETAFTGTGTPPTVTCPVTTLAPGEHTTCTATTYPVTQADMDAGQVTNTATATGTAPNGAAVTSPSSTATLTASPAPVLAVVKTVSPATVTAAGQTLTYSFDVTNTGNVTVSAIAIDESAFTGTGTLSPATCTATTLAPGDHTTCTATYKVTQADIDAGGIANAARATGTAPDGSAVTSAPSTSTATATQSPALGITKSASPATVTNAGQTVTYTFAVTNTGNVTVNAIAIGETAFTGTGTLPPVTCPEPTVAPGDQVTCTATYTVTQADIDAGSITNTANASGTAPDGTTVTSLGTSTATVAATASPALTVVKSAALSSFRAGQVITYGFVVTNTGNLTIHGITIDETAFSGTGTPSPVTCLPTTLAPGAQAICTATYDITQADVDAGRISNTAEAAGTAPNGSPVTSPPSTVTAPQPDNPALTVGKSASPGTITKAGETVTYNYLVTNTGNVTIHGITAGETAFSGTGTLSPITCPVTTLIPGQRTTCTATYTVTQADVDAGGITNTANASGTAPDGSTVTSPPSTTTAAAIQTPALTTVQTANPAAVDTAGETVTYTFDVGNAGNVTIHGVTVDDTTFTGTGTLSPITCTVTTLAPGEHTTCTATYTVTQADIDAGVTIIDTADADGLAPNGSGVTSPPSTTAVTVSQAPGLTLVKSASPANPSSFTAGQVVTYSFLETNTGNVTIHGLAISENAFSGTGTLSPITCPAAILAPGAQTTCTATYTITQADVDAGHVTNSATASGTAPDGTTVTSPESTIAIPEPPAPALTVQVTAQPGTVTNAGVTETYSFVVTNTGNVTIQDVACNKIGFTGTGTVSAITCKAAPLAAAGHTALARAGHATLTAAVGPTLAPGEQADCIATYIVSQADIDAGRITLTANATGIAPGGSTVTSLPDNAVVTAEQKPALTLAKTASPGTAAAGQKVSYSFLVTDAGNLTIHGITVSEATFTGTGKLSAVSCPVTTLAPGQHITCTATYVVTQADTNAGMVTNTAVVAGKLPNGKVLTSRSSSVSVRAPSQQAVITTGVPGNGSGPSKVKLGLGTGLILLGFAGLVFLVARRRRPEGQQ